jgi:hypothetical protein
MRLDDLEIPGPAASRAALEVAGVSCSPALLKVRRGFAARVAANPLDR